MKLCGYKNGEIGRNHFQDSHNGKAEKLTLDQIAKQLGTSKTNLTRALSIERNLTEPMKQLLEDIAQKMGIDVRTLQNYKLLASMIPELEDLVDTGCLFLW